MSNLKNEAILHVSMESDGRQSSSLSFYLSVPISMYPKRTGQITRDQSLCMSIVLQFTGRMRTQMNTAGPFCVWLVLLICRSVVSFWPYIVIYISRKIKTWRTKRNGFYRFLFLAILNLLLFNWIAFAKHDLFLFHFIPDLQSMKVFVDTQLKTNRT